MAEPHTSAAAGYALGAGVSFSQIFIFGARADFIVAGVLVAVYASMVLRIEHWFDAFAGMECREAVRDADRWPDLSRASLERAMEYERALPKPVHVFMPIPHVMENPQ